MTAVDRIPLGAHRDKKAMTLSSQSVSVTDLLAYQIGWGKLVIGWYEVGVVQKGTPQMPGDGFTEWKYNDLARHFFKKWPLDQGYQQEVMYYQVATKLIEIVEELHKSGTLDKEGVYEWANLSSGKPWPLAKWIRVNSAAPYDRAAKLVRGFAG